MSFSTWPTLKLTSCRLRSGRRRRLRRRRLLGSPSPPSFKLPVPGTPSNESSKSASLKEDTLPSEESPEREREWPRDDRRPRELVRIVFRFRPPTLTRMTDFQERFLAERAWKQQLCDVVAALVNDCNRLLHSSDALTLNAAPSRGHCSCCILRTAPDAAGRAAAPEGERESELVAALRAQVQSLRAAAAVAEAKAAKAECAAVAGRLAPHAPATATLLDLLRAKTEEAASLRVRLEKMEEERAALHSELQATSAARLAAMHGTPAHSHATDVGKRSESLEARRGGGAVATIDAAYVSRLHAFAVGAEQHVQRATVRHLVAHAARAVSSARVLRESNAKLNGLAAKLAKWEDDDSCWPDFTPTAAAAEEDADEENTDPTAAADECKDAAKHAHPPTPAGGGSGCRHRSITDSDLTSQLHSLVFRLLRSLTAAEQQMNAYAEALVKPALKKDAAAARRRRSASASSA